MNAEIQKSNAEQQGNLAVNDGQDVRGAQGRTADVRTPNQERWLGGQLWCELTSTTYPPLTRNAWWDLPVNPKRKASSRVAVKCGRCDGKGAIASFSIRYSGVCFACGGSGVRLISKAAYARRKAARAA